MQKDKSLLDYCATFFCLCFFITVTGLLLILQFDNARDRLHRQMQQQNDALLLASRQLSRWQQAYELYLRTNANEDMVALFLQANEVSTQLVEVQRWVAPEDVAMCERLLAVAEYQQQCIKRMFLHQPGAAPLREDSQFITLSLNTLHQEYQDIMSHTMRLASKRFEQQLALLRAYRVVVTVLAAAGILLTFFGCFWQLKRIWRDFHTLQQYAQRLGARRWEEPDLLYMQYQETAQLGQALNHMKHELVQYMERSKQVTALEKQVYQQKLEQEQTERLLVTAQLNSLKMQVNPHFLFNMLNVIGKTALLNDSERLMELIEDTSQILRYSFSNLSALVPLEREFAMLQKYCALQQSRFPDRVSFQICCAPQTRAEQIPPMILQPLVENSLKYGMGCGGVLHIRVESRREGRYLRLCVEDDGCGFDVAAVQRRSSEGSIGLQNVRERLRLLYHQQAQMLVESQPGAYTRVTLQIPLQEPEEAR